MQGQLYNIRAVIYALVSLLSRNYLVKTVKKLIYFWLRLCRLMWVGVRTGYGG